VAKLLLLDGNSLTYRAFFALPTDMATASGQVTNAVFGFTSMLVNLIRDHEPDGIAVAFDRPEPTFRHEMLPEYKAQREETPDILRQQMGLVREVLGALNIPVVEEAGYEADDLLATMAVAGAEHGDEVILVTGDRDIYQMVRDPHIRVLYNRRGVSDYALYDEAGIVERTGVTPALYPQYAALRGDPSDNLPGVPGVGEKTAAKLINKYGGLDGIFDNVDEQTPKLRENLTEHEERARRNLEVMVLLTDAPVGIDVTGLSWGEVDVDEVQRLFDFLESSKPSCSRCRTQRSWRSASGRSPRRRLPSVWAGPPPPTGRWSPWLPWPTTPSVRSWSFAANSSATTGWSRQWALCSRRRAPASTCIGPRAWRGCLVVTVSSSTGSRSTRRSPPT
jgi:DNA polymerase-1